MCDRRPREVEQQPIAAGVARIALTDVALWGNTVPSGRSSPSPSWSSRVAACDASQPASSGCQTGPNARFTAAPSANNDAHAGTACANAVDVTMVPPSVSSHSAAFGRRPAASSAQRSFSEKL